MTMETSNQSRERALASVCLFVRLFVSFSSPSPSPLFPLPCNIYGQTAQRVNESYLRLLWNSLNEFRLIVYTFFDLNVAGWWCYVFFSRSTWFSGRSQHCILYLLTHEMFLISSNWSFPVHLCAVQCLIIPRKKKKFGAQRTPLLLTFLKCYSIELTRTPERTTTMAYGWE